SGQRFRGAVLCEDATNAPTIVGMLEGATFQLGRSRTATYGGGARVTRVSTVAGTTSWEVATSRRAHVLWLTSDYLGRSDAGTPDPSTLLADIAEALGLARNILQDARVFLAHRVVHGMVGRWQMPRPAHPAVAAGSVVILPDHLEINPSRLEELVWSGIGERRAEGFGRIAAVTL